LREFFERHRLLLLYIIPGIFFAGYFSTPAALVLSVIATFYLLKEGKHDSVILLLVIALVFGDTRMYEFLFAKPLRIVMMVILSAYSLWEFRLGYYQFNKLFLFFMPFFVVSLLALVFSPMLDLGISKTISFALLYFLAFHYLYYRFRQHQITLLVDIMFMCHLVIFAGLVLLPIFPWMVSYGGLRYNGMLGNPNGMGLFCVLVTPITIYVFEKVPGIAKRYKNLAWIALFLSLAMCSSRNSILSITIFWTLYFAFRGNSIKGLIFIFVVMPLATLFIMTVDFVALAQDLGLERYLRLQDIESGSGRVHAWEFALELIEKNPIVGCGFACEEYNYLYRMNFRLLVTGHQGGVHNSYLAYLINTGFVGSILYFGFLVAIFRFMKSYRITIPIAVSFAMSAMFESWLFSSLNPFHILLLIIMVWFLVDSQTQDLLESKLVEKTVDPNVAFIQ
jgi:O-antigen ligase